MLLVRNLRSASASSAMTAMALALGTMLVSGLTAVVSAEYTAQEGDTPAVHTSLGDVVGVFQESPGGKKFMAFRGIPYAKPPTGELRFQAPQPAEKWEGVLAARTEGNMCHQPMSMSKRLGGLGLAKKMSSIVKKLSALPNLSKLAGKYLTQMSEDCLYLNVYTPLEALPSDSLLPVLVFLHGGGFSGGSGDALFYGPEYLMEKGVLLVTLNYRLGPIGFLATNTSDAPGNAGIKDQRQAMRWVRDNAKAFGGDPDKITIYGESAGSYSVHIHVLSPASKGLFRSAIMSSSMVPNSYGFEEDPVSVSRRLAEAAGADADTAHDPAKLVAFLRTVPAKELLAKYISSINPKEELHSLARSLPWSTVVEPAGTEDPVLTRPASEIMQSGDFNRVPMMVGLNSEEGSLIYPLLSADIMDHMSTEPTIWVPEKMYGRLDQERRQEVAKKILQNYFKGQPLGNDTVGLIGTLFGDEMLGHGIHVASRWHAKHSTTEAPVFLYLFDLPAFRLFSTILGVDDVVKGAGHADDLGYVFRAGLMEGVELPNKDRAQKGIARMTELISNFVKEGNPTPTKTDAVDVQWAPATPGKERYLHISDDLVAKEGLPFAERMAFWDDLSKEVLQDPLFDF